VARAAIDVVPGLLGYVGVDVLLGDDGQDWVIEINPRLTTSYVGLRALAASNLCEALWRIVRGAADVQVDWRAGSVAFTADGSVIHSLR
jgi:hypothetical protein